MPNWCFSTLDITGPKDEIKSIVATELDFEKILPTPVDLDSETCVCSMMTEFQRQANLAIHGCEDWYDWCVSNWGTKWTAENLELAMINDTTIQVTMDTAWSLPIPLLKKLSAEHPNTTISLDCEEEAGFFVGDCTILNGCIIEDNIHEPSREEMRQRGMLCGDET